LKAQSKKDKSRANWVQSNYQSNRQLRCNLKDNSLDVQPKWELISEITKQTFDRVPNLRPVALPNLKECGEISAFDGNWDRVSAKKPKALKPFNGKNFEESLFEDDVMVELIENDAADVFTTDVIAAALMCASKSNYSWDIEIKKYGNKIFIDKRQDEESADNNILNFYTVGETAIDGQPQDDSTINGIKSLMREAKEINNSFLHHSLSPDLSK
jgi:translation initiation factor 3 subunit D